MRKVACRIGTESDLKQYRVIIDSLLQQNGASRKMRRVVTERMVKAYKALDQEVTFTVPDWVPDEVVEPFRNQIIEQMRTLVLLGLGDRVGTETSLYLYKNGGP